MHRFVIVLTCTAGAGLAFVACGGAGGQILFGTGGAGGAGSTGSTSSGPGVTTSGSSSSSGSTGGANGSSTSSGVATSVSSTSSTSSSSSTSGLPPPQVPCGGTPGGPPQECATGDICCFNPTGTGDFCDTVSDCKTSEPTWSVLACAGPADCPGEFCCATADFTMNLTEYLGSSCQPTCNNPSTDIVLCSQGGQLDASACPAGMTCAASQVLDPGYFVCNPGMGP